jgi:hypothetical protein
MVGRSRDVDPRRTSPGDAPAPGRRAARLIGALACVLALVAGAAVHGGFHPAAAHQHRHAVAVASVVGDAHGGTTQHALATGAGHLTAELTRWAEPAGAALRAAGGVVLDGTRTRGPPGGL